MEYKIKCLADFLNESEDVISIVDEDKSIYSVKMNNKYQVLTPNERLDLFTNKIISTLHEMNAEDLLKNTKLIDDDKYFSSRDLINLIDVITNEHGKDSLPLLLQLIGDKDHFFGHMEAEYGIAFFLSSDDKEHFMRSFNLYIYKIS
jgi:hypothetical protein